MPNRRITLFALLLAFTAFGESGCIMHRTIKDGDAVVAQGYVVTDPLLSPPVAR